MDLWGDKKTPEEIIQKCLQSGEKLLWYRWIPMWHISAWIVVPIMLAMLFPVISMFLLLLLLSFFTKRFWYPWEFPLIATGLGMLFSLLVIHHLNKINKGRFELISNQRILQGEILSFELDKKNRPQIKFKEISLVTVEKVEFFFEEEGKLYFRIFPNKGILHIQNNEQSITFSDLKPTKEFQKSLPVELQQRLKIKPLLNKLPGNNNFQSFF